MFTKWRGHPTAGNWLQVVIVKKNSEFGKSHLAVWDTSDWQVIFEQIGDDETLELALRGYCLVA